MVAEAVAALAPPAPPAAAERDAARELYLTCVLQGIGYLLPGGEVREVEALGALTPVPHTLPWLRGVMNLRGAVVPVVDLARFLGFTREASAGRVALVCADGDDALALAVDAVSAIHRVAEAEILPLPEHVASRTRFLSGLYRTPAGLLGVLDLPRLLRDLELHS